jgi:hypothetical protein
MAVLAFLLFAQVLQAADEPQALKDARPAYQARTANIKASPRSSFRSSAKASLMAASSTASTALDRDST